MTDVCAVTFSVSPSSIRYKTSGSYAVAWSERQTDLPVDFENDRVLNLLS